MLKMWVVLGLSLLCGCAATETQLQNYENCAADPACYAKMSEMSTAASGVVGLVGGALNSDASVPLAAIAALIASLLAGMYFGRKKQVKP